jgi:isoleucyl-tRNA synthetase
VKIKVRQPLAELRVQPGDERERRAVERFADQISEELNVKKVTLHPSNNGPLLTYEVKPNPKMMGPKFGARLKEAQSYLAGLDPAEIGKKLQSGQPLEWSTPDGPVLIETADVFIQLRAPEGWAGVADRATQVAIDVRLTEELELEGMARDVTRQVQELRKKVKLELEDRVELYLGTDSDKLRRAIDSFRDYIASETLTLQWSNEPITDVNAHAAEVKIDGQTLRIILGKMHS